MRDYLSSSKGFWRHVPIKLSREVWPCKPECIKEFQNPASCTGDSVHIEYVTFHVWREIFSIGEISHQAEEKFQLIFVKTVQHLAEFRDSLYKQNLTELQASVPLCPQSQNWHQSALDYLFIVCSLIIVCRFCELVVEALKQRPGIVTY